MKSKKFWCSKLKQEENSTKNFQATHNSMCKRYETEQVIPQHTQHWRDNENLRKFVKFQRNTWCGNCDDNER